MACNSQVTQLLQRIQQEYWSSDQALNGLAVVARHDFINKKMGNVDALHQELMHYVGDDAIKMIAETLFPNAETQG